MLSDAEKTQIRDGMDRIRDTPRSVVDRFYRDLFRAAPDLRSLLPADLDGQINKLLDTLVLLVHSLDRLQELVSDIEWLGRRHAGYGAKEGHYPVVVSVLMNTLSEEIEGWSAEDEVAWEKLLGFVTDLMITGAREAEIAAE